MDKFWENYITTRPVDSKGAFDAFKQMHQDPRPMAQGSRNMYADGQLVTPSVDGSRPGYGGPSSGKFGKYTDKAMANVSDAILKSYAADDISLLFEKTKANPTGLISAQDSKKAVFSMIKNNQGRLDYIVKNTGLDQETILNILDDRDAYIDLERTSSSQKTRYAKRDKFFNHAEKWLTTNAKRYADPEKFEKAFIRTFGKNNLITETIKANIIGPRDKGRIQGFSDDFVKTIMATAQGIDPTKTDVSFNSKQLKDMFKTAIYNYNPNVRKKITKIFENIVPAPGTKRTPDVRDLFANNATLRKFGLDKSIKGPIARLIANEINETLLTNVKNFQKPFLGTDAYLSFLKDRVDPKYKEMFREASNAVKQAQKNEWRAAKRSLNLAQDINFDHKIPSSIIELGYADEIEFIKLQPTSKKFNQTIKRSQFDQPMNDLIREFEDAKTLDSKVKVHGKMETLKNKFSKKYGNYLDEVKIKMDPKGKLTFASDAPVVTKKTDLVKSLETGLQHEKFSTMSKAKQTKFLQLMKTAKTAKGPGKIKALSAIVAMVGAGVAYDLGFNPKEVQAAEAQAAETGVIDKAASWPIEHPWLTGGGATVGAAAVKPIRKKMLKSLSGLFGLSGIAASYPGFAMLGEDWKTDLSKPLDRAFVEGEVALSPTLVKGVDYATKGIKNQKIRSAVQQALNLGMKPGMAMRLAKTASPLGWAALGAEGAYNVAKASKPNYYIDPETQDPTFYKREKAADVLPTMLDIYEQAQNIAKEKGIPYQEALSQVNFERFGKLNMADGGRAGYMGGGMAGIRKPHAIPPERQGLRSIMINVNDD